MGIADELERWFTPRGWGYRREAVDLLKRRAAWAVHELEERVRTLERENAGLRQAAAGRDSLGAAVLLAAEVRERAAREAEEMRETARREAVAVREAARAEADVTRQEALAAVEREMARLQAAREEIAAILARARVLFESGIALVSRSVEHGPLPGAGRGGLARGLPGSVQGLEYPESASLPAGAPWGVLDAAPDDPPDSGGAPDLPPDREQPGPARPWLLGQSNPAAGQDPNSRGLPGADVGVWSAASAAGPGATGGPDPVTEPAPAAADEPEPAPGAGGPSFRDRAAGAGEPPAEPDGPRVGGPGVARRRSR